MKNLYDGTAETVYGTAGAIYNVGQTSLNEAAKVL